MAGVIVDEGKDIVLESFFNNDQTNRVTLVMGLFSNSSGLVETSVLADIIPVTGGSYAPVTITDGGWTVSGGQANFAPIDFTASGSDFSTIYGYYVYTTGATPAMFAFEVSGTAETIIDGATYRASQANTIP